jgi:uncharacterized repeat protein (TIGR01451 family)
MFSAVIARASAPVVAFALAVGGAIVVVSPASVAEAAQSPTACSAPVSLVNGGFENPVIGARTFAQPLASAVPGWDTSASDKKIELWSTGFNGIASSGGAQFAEINATQVSTLSQSIDTTPGETLQWQLDHRGRGGGNNASIVPDVMTVVVGPENGALVAQGPLSDTVAAWGHHTGSYLVPPGQTRTTFGFRSLSSAGGSPSFGNFLDNVSFGNGPCVIATEAVTNLTDPAATGTAHVGDVLQYSLTALNAGGNPANLAAVTDLLPAGITPVAGSIRISNSGATSAATSSAGDDAAEYSAATRTLTARLGAGATAATAGALPAGATSIVTFRATVDLAAALTSIANDATVGFTDPLLASGAATRSARSNQVTTSVAAAVDLAVASSFAVAPTAGRSTAYTIVVTNNGPQAEPAANLAGTVPAALQGATVSVTGGGSCAITASALACPLGAMPVGSTRTITVTGELAASVPSGTALSAPATASGSLVDYAPADNSATATAAVTTSADLAISQSMIGGAAPVAGSPVAYTVTVTNGGPSDATDVTIVDTLPASVGFDSVTSSAGTCVPAGGVLTCSIPTIAIGTTVTVTITGTLTSAAGAHAVTGSATVSAATSDPDLGNNSSTVSRDSVVVSDVSVAIAADSTRIQPGGTVTYTATVANNGPSDAEGVFLSDVIPAGLTAQSVSSPDGACQIMAETAVSCHWASISPTSGGHVVTIVAGVGATIPVGSIQNTATVVSSSPDSSTADNVASTTTTVVLLADLSVSLTADSSVFVPGEVAGYLATVLNSGPTRADHATVTLPLPAGLSTARASTTSGTCAIAAGVVSCELGTLASGETVSIHVSGTLDSAFMGTTVVASAHVDSSAPDPREGNNTASISTASERHIDLAVSIRAADASVPVGGWTSFTVTVRNLGPSTDASTLTISSPGGHMTMGTSTASVGTFDPASGEWNLPTLALADTATLVIAAEATGAGSSGLTVALAANTLADLDLSNNDGSASFSASVDPIRLAFTGFSAGVMPYVGGMLLGLGVIAFLVSRRRVNR